MHNLKSLRNYLKSSTPIIRVQKIDRSPEFNDEYIKFFKPFADQIAFHELLDYKVKETSEPMPDWCCASLWQRMLILADGTIAPCCGLNADIFNLGNVKYDSIGLRWNYYVMNSIRAFHKEGMSHRVSICRKCPLRLHYL
jgi:radical SAM protein with 4Fe4S-binding SPASM domain